MILGLLKKMMGNILYVKVGNDEMTLINPKDGRQKTYRPETKFSSVRQGVGDFAAAEDCLRKAVKDFYNSSFIPASPRIIMHQLVKNEGGLSVVESRCLAEIALCAGARDFFVWEGAELSNEQILNEEYI